MADSRQVTVHTLDTGASLSEAEFWLRESEPGASSNLKLRGQLRPHKALKPGKYSLRFEDGATWGIVLGYVTADGLMTVMSDDAPPGS